MAGRRKPIVTAIAAAVAILTTTTGLTWVATGNSATVKSQSIDVDLDAPARPVLAVHAVDPAHDGTRLLALAATSAHPISSAAQAGTRVLDLNVTRPVMTLPADLAPSRAAAAPERQVANVATAAADASPDSDADTKPTVAASDAASLRDAPHDGEPAAAVAEPDERAGDVAAGPLQRPDEAVSPRVATDTPSPSLAATLAAATENLAAAETLQRRLTGSALADDAPALSDTSNLESPSSVLADAPAPAPVSDRLRALTRSAMAMPMTDANVEPDFLFEAFEDVADSANSRQPLRLAALMLPADPLDRAPAHHAADDDLATSFEDFDLDPDRVVPEWNEYVFARGDNVSDLWVAQWGLPNATLYRLLGDRENARILSRLRPGQKVEWKVDEDGYLTHLRIWGLRGSGHEWTRIEGGWDFERAEIHTERDIHHRVIHAELDGSISQTLARVPGLSAGAAAAITTLMDRHIPAVQTRARTGDRISLLVEYETLPGDSTPLETRLLAFRYQGANINIEAARHLDNRFYKPNGEGLLPPFDRRPFAGNFRISSHFNPRRRHPVTGRVTPHNGTDWAMPVGTPIVAPANGRVTRVETHPYAGRWIEIEHGQGYSTRYLHLSRPLVRVGQYVNRGDRIALSGNTGRSTGPHLHYELHVNNRPVDPVRAELPTSDQLAASELPLFQSIHRELMAQIDATPTSGQIAMRPFASFAD